MADTLSLNGTGSVLFVCLGNICRSPLAEGIFRSMAEKNGLDEILVDSAGTGSWHVGAPPDPRSIAKAEAHGIDISNQRARAVRADDFDRFDLVLAMDRSNLKTLRALAPVRRRARIHGFMSLALDRAEDVPDPYYGEHDGFETVFRMLSEGCAALQRGMFPS